jgi:hypothetical protein
MLKLIPGPARGWLGGLDWNNVAQDRDRWGALVNAVMNLRVPQNAGNFLSSLGRFSFSGRLLHGVNEANPLTYQTKENVNRHTILKANKYSLLKSVALKRAVCMV